MIRHRFTLLSLASIFALLASLAFASGAGATVHSLRVAISPHGSPTATREVLVALEGLDPTLDTKVTARRPGVVTPIYEETAPSGRSSFSSYDFALLEPGDVVEARQPAAAINPVASFPTPTASLNIAGSTVTGTLGAGLVNSLKVDDTCLTEGRYAPLSSAGGAFSTNFGADVGPGSTVRLTSLNSDGFEFSIIDRAPGERACITARSIPLNFGVDKPGSTETRPYGISASYLTEQFPSSRIVLRRGTVILEDQSNDYSGDFSIVIANAPQPGDRVELYRPKTAGAPSQVVTVPPVSGVFDPTIDKAATTGPAARQVSVVACYPLVCNGSQRWALDTDPGRQYFDFSKPEAAGTQIDLQPGSSVTARFQSAAEPIEYRFALSLGDLVAPTQSFRLPTKLKRSTLVKAFKKGYKFKLTSNELAVAKVTLAFPVAAKSAKSKSKAVTLASAKQTLRNGSTNIKLKFTKSGKKALKKLAKGISRTAVLTSTATDPSGNASTVVKKTKIKA